MREVSSNQHGAAERIVFRGLNHDLQESFAWAGTYPGMDFTPDGESVVLWADGKILSEAEWQEQKDDWLPSKADGEFIQSLMVPETAPGKFAGWIAPPKTGIDNKPGDFEYVRIDP